MPREADKSVPVKSVIASYGRAVEVTDAATGVGVVFAAAGHTQLFGPDASNADVYERAVQPLVQHVLSGRDALVIAYGAVV